MSKFKAIIFDLDDTLYPERDYVLSGFRAVSDWAQVHLQIDNGFDELRNLYEQGVRSDTFNRWVLRHDLSVDCVPILVRIYRDHTPHLNPFPEVLELLSSLGEKYSIGLLGDGYVDVQRRKLAALGLAPLFDVIVFSDELGRDAWKPSAKPFEAALQQLACLPHEAIYVADNPLKDFIGARQLGILTLRVRRPGGEYSHLSPPTKEHEPHIETETLAGFQSVLENMESSL